MPLALLLQEVGKTLERGSSRISNWNQLVELESLLVARARSAFLVHWFGYGIPVSGLNLRGYIVNLDELEARYRLAKRSVATSQRGPNLSEPLAGMAGTIVGMLLSPVGAIAGASVLLAYSEFSIKVLLTALAWLLVPAGGLGLPPLGLLLGIAGSGLLAAGALAAGSVDRPEDRALFNLLGGLARFMNAATSLLDQLSGPRSGVRNPLMRRLLELGDAVARALPQVFGFVAILLRRIGPVLVPIAHLFVATRALVSDVVGLLQEIWAGLMDGIDSVLGGPLSPARAFATIIDVIVAGIERLLSPSSHITPLALALFDFFVVAFGAFPSQLRAWASGLYWFLFDLVRASPIVQTFRALKTEIGIFTAALSATPAVERPERQLSAHEAAIPRFPVPVLPDFPSFPTLPTLPDPAAILSRRGAASVAPLTLDAILREAERAAVAPGAPTFALGPDAERGLERARRPRSIFGAELRALHDERGRTPAEQVALSADELGRFRDAFEVIVGRVLPPEMRTTSMPLLQRLFREIDTGVYGRPARSAANPPVRDLPDNDRLRPVVNRLRFRVHGASHGEVRAFQDLLVEKLNLRSYHAPGEP